MTELVESWEFGLRYEWASGDTFISPFGNEQAAVAFLADHSKDSWHPRPVGLVRRACGPWEPVEEAS